MHLLAVMADVAAAATAGGPQAVWTRLDITAHLSISGALHVRETQQIEMLPSVGELGRDFGLGAGQRVVLADLWRLTDDGVSSENADTGMPCAAATTSLTRRAAT